MACSKSVFPLENCTHSVKALTTIDFLFDFLRDDILGELRCLPEELGELLQIVNDWQIQLKRCLAYVLKLVQRFKRFNGSTLSLQERPSELGFQGNYFQQLNMYLLAVDQVLRSDEFSTIIWLQHQNVLGSFLLLKM